MAQVSGQNQSHLLYVWDRNSGHKLLVDTGAQVSVFPASAHERRSQKTEPLIAANGSTIDTFGKRTIPLDLGFRKFTWPFVLADVKRPMLGADSSAATTFSLTSTLATLSTPKRTRVHPSGRMKHRHPASMPALLVTSSLTSSRNSHRSHDLNFPLGM